jgi:hypothetical protein
MRVGRSVKWFGAWAVGGLMLMAIPSAAHAQGEHVHAAPAQEQALTADDRGQVNALVEVVRDSTERFRNVRLAEAAGYALQFGCVSGPDGGAMGLHFINGDLVMDGEIDPTRPEIVIYEPAANGRVRLIGVDYLVLADAWHKKHAAPPQVMGQLMHLFTSPNRYQLPAFYALHVWAWKDSPTGTFVNYHSKVSCDGYNGGQ